jgi:hypothetical protein
VLHALLLAFLLLLNAVAHAYSHGWLEVMFCQSLQCTWFMHLKDNTLIATG